LEIANDHLGTMERVECFSVTDKLIELWDLKITAHEEYYTEVVEKRGIDLSHEAF